MNNTKLWSRDNVRAGLRTGLIIATGYSAWVTVLRLTVGPKAFDRVGLRWEELVALYYLTFSVGGSVYGAFLPLKRHPAGAALLGFFLMCPMYLGAAVLFHLAQNQSGSWREDLALAVVLGIIAGIMLGIWLTMSDEGDSRPPGSANRPSDAGSQEVRSSRQNPAA